MTTDDAEQLFPTQRQFIPTELSPEDIAIGAPYAPLPRSFYAVPRRLNLCQELPTDEQLSYITDIRREFNIGDYQAPYVRDVARAFRLLQQKRTYLEIGTFDRGNLAYVSTLLADDALIIGVDVVDEPTRDALLRANLKPNQRYVSVVGSSRAKDTSEKVVQALEGRPLDAVFIDGDHTAFGVMSDYARYEQLIDDNGVILFHDSVWEGSGQYKGTADALAEIDKLDPVYLIDGENPVRRFLRPQFRNEFWGVVGVVFASDQRWRKQS